MDILKTHKFNVLALLLDNHANIKTNFNKLDRKGV
jgi:hypothetical protein